MRLLTQNVLNYPEVLESSRRSSECLLFFVISIDNDLITEKQLVSREGVTELLKAQNQMLWGAGLRWRPLPQAEAPTDAAAETAAAGLCAARRQACMLALRRDTAASEKGYFNETKQMDCYVFVLCIASLRRLRKADL